MRTEWLEYYADAVRLGSIKASAELHNISPQGMSKAIRSLESELNVKLFKRGANSVHPTPEGEQLLPYIHESIEINRKLNLRARSLAESSIEPPLLVLFSSFVFLCGMFAPLRRSLLRVDRPATCMQFNTDRMIEMMVKQPEDVCEGKVLCGLSLMFSPLKAQNDRTLSKLESKGFSYVPLMRYYDHVLVTTSHPLANHSEVSKAEVIRYPVVSSGVELLRPLSAYLGADNVTTAISNMATRLELIQDNESIMFVPPFVNAAKDSHFRMIPLSDPYEAEIGFIYDSSNLDLLDMTPMLYELMGAYSESEHEGICTIVFPTA